MKIIFPTSPAWDLLLVVGTSLIVSMYLLILSFKAVMWCLLGDDKNFGYVNDDINPYAAG